MSSNWNQRVPDGGLGRFLKLVPSRGSLDLLGVRVVPQPHLLVPDGQTLDLTVHEGGPDRLLDLEDLLTLGHLANRETANENPRVVMVQVENTSCWPTLEILPEEI